MGLVHANGFRRGGESANLEQCLEPPPRFCGHCARGVVYQESGVEDNSEQFKVVAMAEASVEKMERLL